jgi:predicted transcriptional regulator
MYCQQLSEKEILKGFRKGDSDIIREYFYGYCRVGYHLFDQRYHLREKENLDFMSLAHQYAIYLMEHDWKPLEDRSPEVSLRTWLIGGFRYVVLDALKWHRKEYGSITFEDYLMTFEVNNDLRLQFNRMVQDVCDHASLSRDERLMIDMMLLRGFKGKEIAAELGMTPSAVSQKYKKLKEQIIVPYFKKNFDMDMDMPEVIDIYAERMRQDVAMPKPCVIESGASIINEDMDYMERTKAEGQQKRTTPEYITELQPNEIFVFGSNLKGMHGGGAAYIAYRKFGAVMGQGVGLQGQSYGIPTMQGGVETIRPYVDEFIEFAKSRQDLTFLVTRIGCGIAGFTDEEIAPLFEKCHEVENVVLPPGW